MIVTCERCATQFQLDDARVPAGGARVRCSRCKYAFEIRKSAPAAAPSASEDEESDWQFNEDPPRAGGGGATRGSAASVVDDLLGGASPGSEDSLFESASSSGLELSDDPPHKARPEPHSDSPPGAAAAPPSKPSAAPYRDASPVSMPQAGASGLDLEGEPVRVAARKPPAPPAKPVKAAKPAEIPQSADDPVADLASELADELAGDPVSLDIADELSAAAAPAPDELSPASWDALAVGDPDLGSVPRTPTVDPDELIDDRPRWQAGLERVGQGAGWLAVVALLLIGLHGGLLREPDVSLGPPLGSEADGVALRDVSARFVEHAEAGPVYVLSGRLENTGPRPIRAGTLAVQVLDREGRRLAPPAQAAAPLSAEAIREGQLTGPWRQSPALGPGESRTFQAVLGPLPAGAQRLSLTTVEPARMEAVTPSRAHPPADTAADPAVDSDPGPGPVADAAPATDPATPVAPASAAPPAAASPAP